MSTLLTEASKLGLVAKPDVPGFVSEVPLLKGKVAAQTYYTLEAEVQYHGSRAARFLEQNVTGSNKTMFFPTDL